MKAYACFDFYSKNNLRNRIFGHCFLVLETSQRKCLVLDKMTKGVKLVEFYCKASTLVVKLRKAGCDCLKVDIYEPNSRMPELFTCTGFVKKCLNIKKWWIFTPRQLWRHLWATHQATTAVTQTKRQTS